MFICKWVEDSPNKHDKHRRGRTKRRRIAAIHMDTPYLWHTSMEDSTQNKNAYLSFISSNFGNLHCLRVYDGNHEDSNLRTSLKGIAHNDVTSSYPVLALVSDLNDSWYVSNALTAPNYILTLISMIVMCANSDRFNEREFHGALSLTWYFTGFALLAFLPDGTDKGIRYFATLVISSAPFTHPLNIAWLTENTAPIGKRTVASGAVICAANLYGTYAAQIYQPWDAPAYRVGNRIILGFIATAILLFLLRKYFYIQLNKQRAAIWNAKSEDEKAEYNATTKHVGNERLDFVFKN
ncbi:hypothetical protein BCR33DRAFT_804707 [Rhizoclosmatium globosum]|uniref:MFS general substrate transporter n=1 Tax=Rhizoclosmatium globosum TaxID=329046 RepID=A0A1Y2AUX1_9FUNG|nr:hypothetical protein BCR33DRAFT_804707 [Rhizoclosmatium globosum]|eukprot:ORY26359.1 hypothetical protein BCR33DRAFT_804707 [Rhizoclosmatium globosum]